MINFRSKITQKVLTYFLLNPEKELYVNEIANQFSVDRGNLVRKLAEWEKEGILVKNEIGNLSLYKINKNYYLLSEITKIAQKTFGIEDRLKNVLEKEKGLKHVFIFGSYAKDKLEAESDIDILIVGSHKSFEIEKKINEIQSDFGREINIIDMTEDEFNEKKKNSEFIKNIFNDKYIQII